MGRVALTCVPVYGWRTTSFAIRTMVSYGVEAMFNSSRCNNGRSLLTNPLVRMSTAPEYHCTTLLSLGNILGIYRSINGVPRSVSTARFSTLLNQTLTCKSPIQTKRSTVPKSFISSFIALRDFGTDWYLILFYYSFWRMVILTNLRPATVSRRHTCGCSWLKLIPTWSCTLFVGFAKSAAVAGVTRSEKVFSLRMLLIKVVQRTSQLLHYLVVGRMRCQLTIMIFRDHQLGACLTSESLFGFYFLSHCSCGVCCTRHPPAEPR